MKYIKLEPFTYDDFFELVDREFSKVMQSNNGDFIEISEATYHFRGFEVDIITPEDDDTVEEGTVEFDVILGPYIASEVIELLNIDMDESD